MFRPRLPFFRKPEHKRLIQSTYRRLLRQAKGFSDPVEHTYLWSWIRERFHHNKRQTSPSLVDMQLSDAAWTSLVMSDALAGIHSQRTLISDLAYGREGRLKDVMRYISEFHHPTKSCELIRDVRPRASRLHQPHSAYRIPLDLRAFTVPRHLLDRIKEEDEMRHRREKEKQRRKEKRLAKEIEAMTRAVNNGNEALWDAGLVPGAFSVEPSVSRGPHYIPGVVGNMAWIPPKIKNRLDPPFVQHVRASSGCEFFRVNARKPPHWLSNKIAATYRNATKRVQRHEFFYYFIEDLKLEEEFEERLGIEDRGYWIYARNYRDFLRNKIRNFTLQAEGDEVNNKELLEQLWEGEQGYDMLVEYSMKQRNDDYA
ncbi:hypothetical protein GQ54DRAFT_261573 [Martensiomyces pterosporus]|nr:hypothetical protein GQ54DRAFT_261573 [Martensiomyces pterosporus]